MKFEIPILHKIEARAREVSDSELQKLLEELDEARGHNKRERDEILKVRGTDCPVCGRRFLPLAGEWACSIGCRNT